MEDNVIDHPFGESTDFTDAKKYLSDRGIPIDDHSLNKCGLTLVGNTLGWQVLKRKPPAGDTRVGIVIDFPGANYQSVRWVGNPPFNHFVKREKGNKIEGQFGMPVPCYIPDFIEYKDTLYICESPLKALTMCLRGYPAIASNGVWSMWRKDRQGNLGWAEGFPMPEMELVDKVVILFDNDVQQRDDLALSVRLIGDALQREWPSKKIMHRPLLDPDDGGKWGIDDAIAALGDEWLAEWLADDNAEESAQAGELQRHFDALNEEYCVIREKGFVMHKSSASPLSFSRFEKVEANRTVPSEKKNAEPVSAVKKWEQSEDRSDADVVQYIPGEAMMCTKRGKRVYNIWEDDGVASIKGDMSIFHNVYENTIQDKEVRDLMFKSLAWMLQNRGKKLNKLFFFVGRMGSGKSFLAHMLTQVFGRKNATSIGELDLTGQFNAHYASKELVCLDDLHKLEKPQMGKVKKLVTDYTVIVNGKMSPQFEIDSYMVFFVTSNELKALPLPDGDRRVLVIDATPAVHYPDGHEWWNSLGDWCENGGYEALRHWLENMDLSDYNPNFVPPLTELKAHIVESALSPEQQWAVDLEDNMGEILPTPRSVYTSAELFYIFSGGEESTQSKSYHLVEALKDKFFPVASPNGKVAQIRNGGPPTRYWKIRNKGITAEEARADVKEYPNATNKEIKDKY